MWKPKFIEKIVNEIYTDDEGFDDTIYEEDEQIDIQSNNATFGKRISLKDSNAEQLTNTEIQTGIEATDYTNQIDELSVDVFQTPEEIVVVAMIAGVPVHNIDITLTREIITISGTREEQKEVTDDDYFLRELYWGSFSRTISLPAEVEVDDADAKEKNGVLTIRLPKTNKDRQTKVKVRSR